MTYVLIVIIKAGYAGMGLSAEFDDLQSCEYAKSVIYEKRGHKLGGSNTIECFPKSGVTTSEH